MANASFKFCCLEYFYYYYRKWKLGGLIEDNAN